MQRKIWNKNEIDDLYNLPFLELILKAQNVQHENFKESEIELCSLLSIKTGKCPEDCAYCPQSAHFKTNIENIKLMQVDEMIVQAIKAKEAGAKRFCMGAAWRSPNKKDFAIIVEAIKEIKKLGLESCVTLGMISEEQAKELKEVGLDYYNHNLDTSPDYYQKIITTRTFEDRITTIKHISDAGIKVCCGGIIGMGETKDDQIEFLRSLSNLPTIPESIPINKLIKVENTPLGNVETIDNLTFVRIIAIARIMFPKSIIRLSAGRNDMSQEMQILCFIAGARSIFLGEKLLTTQNSDVNKDLELLSKLGISYKKSSNYEHVA